MEEPQEKTNHLIDRNNAKTVPPTTIVGIGASAGGLEALNAFFENMPENSGMAFIVVQHLSPDYKSMMVELLSRKTNINVLRVEDGMKVQADSIYLIPPEKNLTLFQGKLFLAPQTLQRGLKLPIDVLFQSLAKDLGGKAIGVILSGTGSDGTLGIRHIKEAGGMVVVQDPSDAKFDGMPQSALLTGVPDIVLPASQIPKALIDFIKHPLSNTSAAAEDAADDDRSKALPGILAVVHNQLGIDFSQYKQETVVRRIERRISVNQLHSMAEYLAFLQDVPNEVNVLHKELLIGVTRFFRDTEAFAQIQELVIPKLFEGKPLNTPIRVWSAACSTGEEPYSIAILLLEHMQEHGLYNNVKVFATDLDKNAIDFASQGSFPESMASDVGEERLKRFFAKEEGSFRINDKIRKMVIFAEHNLTKDPPFSKIDLVICRNLLIYFKPEMQRKVLNMFHYALNENSYLFLGSSESINLLSPFFEPVSTKWKIFQSKKSFAQALHHSPLELDNAMRFRTQQSKNLFAPSKKAGEGTEMMDDILEQLIEIFSPASVLLNARREVMFFFSNANRFVHMPKGRVSWNILDLVSPGLAPLLSNILKQAEAKDQLIYYKGCTYKDDEGKLLTINLTAKKISSKRNANQYFIVAFNENEPTKADAASVAAISIDQDISQRITDLERELQHRDESLQTTIEELETTNEELQATNEELVASNEELQSTNEELQSVNEELYTVNSEYQNKIEELTQLNSDMNNLLRNTLIGTLFLDSSLQIRKFTNEITHLFNVLSVDIGRSIFDISHNATVDVHDIIRKVRLDRKMSNTEIQNFSGGWYMLRVQPYEKSGQEMEGVIVTLVDINELKKAQKAARSAENRLQKTIGAGKMAWWDWDYETGKVDYSPIKAHMLGYEPEELEPMVYAFTKMIHPDDYEKAMKDMRDHLTNKVEIYETEYRLRCKDGSYKWLYDRGGITERDKDGKPKRIAGVVFDISLWKEQRQKADE